MMQKFSPAFERRLMRRGFRTRLRSRRRFGQARASSPAATTPPRIWERRYERDRRQFTLDGERIAFEPGQTILKAALAAGIYIPHLCAHPDFPPHGTCKLCAVIVNGRNGSACTIRAIAGQEVRVDTPELNAMRRAMLQMLFVEGNHFCPGCEKSGNCQLQALGLRIRNVDSAFRRVLSRADVDASHPDALPRPQPLHQCELCVRASRDVDARKCSGSPGAGSTPR